MARGSGLPAVIATNAGTSKPQAGSIRNNVLLRIQAAPGGAVSVADLDAHFAQPTRGFLQKLIEKDHLRVITLDELAAAHAKK